MSKRMLLLVTIAASVFLSSSCGKKTSTLNLLVWEGYADPSFVRGFEEKYHCKVLASYMGSSDELVAKLRGGSAGNYDVISPSSDVATSIASAGLAAPLDLSKISSYSQLSPQLTSLSLVKTHGNTYGVPFTWGPNPMIYDTTALGRRKAGTYSGIRNTGAESLFGMISRRCTWQRRCWGMIIRRANSTT